MNELMPIDDFITLFLVLVESSLVLLYFKNLIMEKRCLRIRLNKQQQVPKLWNSFEEKRGAFVKLIISLI
jgi:hypothetical protein